jgi:hypothetical protein
MIMVTKFQETALTGPKNSKPRQEMSRLLTAAVISNQFRQMLLANPGKALTNGYGGESFNLPREQQKRVASIRANNLSDFASQLNTIDPSWAGSALSGD